MMNRILAALLAAVFSATALADTTWAEGEVRRVDKAAGKVTLKHGEIRNIDMPPMTMVFQVPDKALLDKLQAGDRVRFTAEQKDGQYLVRQIEPQR